MEVRPVIIIGSGPAGYTAALYAARAGRKPLMLGGFMMGGQSGGQLMTTTEIENFPGFPKGIEGPDLMQRMREQVIRFGAEVLDKDVQKVDFSKSPFKIWADDEEYQAHTVIISTGATARRLHNDAENKFWNKGISACATCDGALPIFRNKPIAVIGGGDTAMEEATFLARFGSSVTVLHRREEFRASAVMLERAKKNPKIHWKIPYNLIDSHGDGLLEKLTIKNEKTGQVEELAANGLFLAIGHEPNTGIFKGQIELHETGYIKTDGDTRTNIKGVYAAGDCVDHVYRQAITAAGQGCMAAIQSERYLETLDHHATLKLSAY
jgi:thioredoxin reductase (NADPH)